MRSRLGGTLRRATPANTDRAFLGRAGRNSSTMLGRFLELILGPCRNCVDISVLVTHEIGIRQGDRAWRRSNPEKPSDVCGEDGTS